MKWPAIRWRTLLNLERLRPGRAVASAVIGFLWSISFGVVRDFVWADLRAGLINLRGLSRGTRLVAWLGFTLLFGMVAVMVFFYNAWRTQFALVSMPVALNMDGRGTLIPVVLVPMTDALLAIAWAFVLTGLLHSHPVARLGIVSLYVLSGLEKIAVLFPGVALGASSPWELLIRGGLLLAVPIFFALRWKPRSDSRSLSPTVEFLVLLGLVSASLAITHYQEVSGWRASGTPLLLNELDSDLLNLRLVIAPLLLLIGMSVANFARQIAGWATDVARVRLPGWAPAILLILLAWRLIVVIQQTAGLVVGTSVAGQALAYAGGLGQLLVVGAMTWLVMGAGPPAALSTSQNESESRDNVPAAIDGDQVLASVRRIALPLILLYGAVQLASFVLLVVAGAFPLARFGAALNGVASTINDQLTLPWRAAVYGLALVGAVVVALRLRLRRGHRLLDLPNQQSRPMILFLGIFGATGTYLFLTARGNLLQTFAWRGFGPLAFWWTLLLAAVALFWLAQHRLSPARALQLLFALVIVILLQQTGFIESRFSPLLGFAGVGFIAFGIVWDTLTGATWVNGDSAGLPRAGRIFLYIGYALLMVTVINWALAGHDLGSLAVLTGGAIDAGFSDFGQPLLYTVLVVTLLQPEHRD